MKKMNNQLKLLAVSLLLFAISCGKESTHAITPAEHIQQSEQTDIPASIELPANEPYGNKRELSLFARGVQKYQARPKAGGGPGVYEWFLSGPRADLYDETNAIIGMHAAGPYWKIFLGGIIQGEAFDPVRSAPSDDPRSIDWLLLKPKQGSTPTGVFANIQYIQRIATRGGKAPATAPLTIPDSVEVPYTAIYRFSRKNV